MKLIPRWIGTEFDHEYWKSKMEFLYEEILGQPVEETPNTKSP